MSRAYETEHYFLKSINPVVRFLILSDTLVLGSTGLLGPVFAIFVEDFIVGGNVAVAGVAAGIFVLTKSILQIPVAHFIDKVRGEKDDFWVMFSCTLIMSLIPLLYLIISTPYELYFVQLIYGLAASFTTPPFMALFTRHIDKDKEGTEWSVYFTFTGIIMGIFAALGGYIASTQGFPALISVVVFISVCGALLLLLVKPYILTDSL